MNFILIGGMIISIIVIIIGIFYLMKTDSSEEGDLSPSDNYNFYPMKDSKRDNVQTLKFSEYYGDIERIAEECNKDDSCIAFNSGGWLKGSLDPKFEWAPAGSGWMKEEDDGLYVEKGYDIPKKYSDNYNFYPMKDSKRDNVQTLDFNKYYGKIEEIAKKCDENKDCIAFNSGGWLKGSLDPKSEWAPSESGWMTNTDGLYVSKSF